MPSPVALTLGTATHSASSRSCRSPRRATYSSIAFMPPAFHLSGSSVSESLGELLADAGRDLRGEPADVALRVRLVVDQERQVEHHQLADGQQRDRGPQRLELWIPQ